MSDVKKLSWMVRAFIFPHINDLPQGLIYEAKLFVDDVYFFYFRLLTMIKLLPQHLLAI